MAGKTVYLNPGESEGVTFEATPTVAKTYQVSVDGLSGSFVAQAAPVGEVEITSISMSKTSLVEADPFTVSITFSNPHDYDVWVRPEFSLGGQAVLCGYDPDSGSYTPNWVHGYEVNSKWVWVDLGGYQPIDELIPEAYGSNMTPYLYAPDGAALTSGEHAYLKVPAKGQATTSILWYTSYYARSKRVWDPWGYYSWYEVYPPIDLTVNVKVESAFNLIYHPEGIGIIRYGLPWAIGDVR
ncbi:unnamed protein product, partial [marine sediment metagenome]